MKNHLMKRLAALVLAAGVAVPVHAAAGVYLMDDDGGASASGWASSAPATPRATASNGNQVNLPFNGMRSTLDADTGDLLSAIVGDLKTAGDITLTYMGNGRTPKAIALRHANAIKAKLRAMGIYAAVATDVQSGYAQAGLQLSWQTRIPAPAPVSYNRAPRADAYTPPGNSGTMSPEKQFMLQKLMEASAQGKIAPDAALSMMREITGTASVPVQPQPQPTAQIAPAAQPAPALTYASYAPAPRAVPQAVQEARNNIVPMNSVPTLDISAAPETRRLPTWQLDPSQTLKDHMDKWAKQEGYTLDWQASNYYKINRPQTLKGDYLDVVNQIAGVISPTKVSLNRGARLIRVAD